MPLPTPEGYHAFDDRTLLDYIEQSSRLSSKLGGTKPAWQVKEVGDGNLNLVFIVEGSTGDLCIKQALPYVRLVGESWPLPLKRAFFEHEAAKQHSKSAPGLLPEILHYDPKLYLIAMERLSPHIIMRQGMIEGTVYPHFAEHISGYLAATLFHTSDLAMPADQKKTRVAVFSDNTDLCKITEDLIFTDPYQLCERNRWTSPQLDAAARGIREDSMLKRRVAELKWRFMTRTEALLHGDLHTGSIMLTQDDTKVIDPEFAFYGPMGFDVGKLIGNLLLCYFSQTGHEASPGDRDSYRRWILETVEAVWNHFERKFLALWSGCGDGGADPKAILDGSNEAPAFVAFQKDFMRSLLIDALGFAGCSMIRRTLGLAHNIDMEAIADNDLRAQCESRNLALAVQLIKQAAMIGKIEEVTAKAALIEAAKG